MDLELIIMNIPGLPRSMPNADQSHGIDPKCLSMLIGIDWHWDQCQNFDRHWSALGIDRGSPNIQYRHWSTSLVFDFETTWTTTVVNMILLYFLTVLLLPWRQAGAQCSDPILFKLSDIHKLITNLTNQMHKQVSSVKHQLWNAWGTLKFSQCETAASDSF